MILTPAQFREHMADDVALSDDALKVMLDANEASIVEWAGALGTITETIYGYGMSLLMLRQAPVEVLTVTDYLSHETVLTADDYRIRGNALERTNRVPWGRRTTVSYVSAASAARYIVTLVKLMKADLNYQPGLSGQGAGPWQESYQANHQAERQAILEELRAPELFA